MRVANDNLLTLDGAAVSSSLASSRNYKPIWLGHMQNFSVQCTYTGTPSGTFKLQGSDDVGQVNSQSEANQSTGVTHWTDIADSSVVVAAAGDFMINYQNCGFEWVRLVWTASGAGTTPVLTNARLKCKGGK